jgi:O-antigen/teichoic acid export membrane protein
MAHYRNIVKHTSVYAIAIAARRLLGVFLLPVYTRYLTPADYGIAELLDLIGGVLTNLLGLRLADAVLYFYAHAAPGEEQDRISQTALLGGHILGFAVGGAGFLFANQASTLAFGTPEYGRYFRLMFIGGLAFGLPQDIGFGYLRAQYRSGTSAVLSVLRLIFAALITLVLLIRFKMGVAAVLYATGFGTLAMTLYFNFRILRWPLRFDWGLLRALWRYALPIGISAAGILFLHSGDHFFLLRYATLADVGLYSLAYKLGQLVGNVQVPFETYWDAQVFHVVRGPDGDRHFVRTLTYYSLVLFGAAVAISVSSSVVLRLFTTSAYHGAAVLTPIIAFAYAIRGIGDYFRGVFAIHKEPSRNVTVMAWATGITLLGCITLIPRFKAWGAALTTLVAFVGMGLVAFQQAGRIRQFPYEWTRIGKIVATAVAVTVAALVLRPPSLVGQVLAAAAAILAFPLVLSAIGFLYPDEWSALRQQFGAVARRLRRDRVADAVGTN